jgi:membrane fusion protein (multidrug efflux system)
MMGTQRNVWAFGLALGLAVGGSVGCPPAQAQFAPLEPGVEPGAPEKKEAPSKVVVTSPQVNDVVVTQHYPCQIRSRRHIAVRALSAGSLEAIPVREGQAVKKGDVLFKVVATLHKARLDAELAEVKLAQIELDNTRKLFDQKVVARQELALYKAKLARAQARAKLAEAELGFATVRAPFGGLVGRLM